MTSRPPVRPVRHVRAWLVEYVQGSLTTDDAVETHLLRCPPCLGEAAAISTVAAHIARLRMEGGIADD